jgi:proteic killer suppression protein
VLIYRCRRSHALVRQDAAEVLEERPGKGIDPRSVERLQRLLSLLDAAIEPKDMDQPGYAFHTLTGNRAGQYAVEIRANHRLVFEWDNGEAVRVRIEDYHGK